MPNQSEILAPGTHAFTFAEYHAIDAWGSSALKAMRRGPPARVVWERESESKDTDATILGTAVHCKLLTPDLYAANYAVKPEGMSFATKEGKAWRDDPERAGRILLSHDVGAQVDQIVEALLSNKRVNDSLGSAGREVSFVWDCSVTGERCKGRPDWFDDECIYDLKVSRHAASGYLTLRTFSEGWMHQSAHYRTGAIEVGLRAIKHGRLVVVDPTPPHFIYTLEIKPDALNALEWENIETLKALRECRLSGSFPGTPDEWKKIDMPAAALAQMGDQFGTEDEGTEEAA